MTRVTGFLAAALLCLSVFAAFPEDARAEFSLSVSTTGCETYDSCLLFTITDIPSDVDELYLDQERNGVISEHNSITFTPPWPLSYELDFSSLPANTSYRFRLFAYYDRGRGSYNTNFTEKILKGSVVCGSQSTTDLQIDCATLETLYDDTGGANWKTSTNWKTSNSLDQWDGVSVTGGRVSSVDLYNNQLTGTIPSELSSLAGLLELDLGVNSLSGTIPDLSSLDNLLELSLEQNNLSGSVPDLSGFEKLMRFRAELNSLGGTIDSTGLASSKIEWLYLNSNKLSGTVPDLSSNKYLREIYLNDNNLGGTLDALVSGRSRSLVTVELNNNRLSGTIPDLSKLNVLTTLNVAGNNLSGTLSNLTTADSLWNFDLGGNNISGTIPDLGFLNSRTLGLSLYGNRLSGSLPDLSSFTNLNFIDLSDNDFSGEMGDLGGSSGDLSVFGELYVLDVSGNRLSGEIPESLKLSRKLEYFQFNDNNLSGSVPDLSGLTRLKALGIWGNPNLDLMNITLPSGMNKSLIDWAALWTLHYKNNGYGWNSRSKWTGNSPMGEWHGVTTGSDGRVTVLNLRNNNLRGGISGSIAALGSMTTLNLSCNTSLSGELPLGLKDIATLTNVNICSTGMTLPSDQAFTNWKDGNGITFTDGTCSGANACPAPVSQQSSPPPPPVEEQEGGASGDEEEGADEPEEAEDEQPVASGDTEGGGCALVSEAGGSKPGAAFVLLLCASVLMLAVSRRGRRQSGERRHSG